MGAGLESKNKHMAQWFGNESKVGRSVVAHLNDAMATLKKGHSELQEGLQECRNIMAATRHTCESTATANMSTLSPASQIANCLSDSSCIVSDTGHGEEIVDVVNEAASQPNAVGDVIASQMCSHQSDSLCAARFASRTCCTCKERLDTVTIEQER